MINNETEEKTLNTEIEEESQPVLDDAQIRAAALAYARFLNENGLVPGDEAPAGSEAHAVRMRFQSPYPAVR